MLSFQVVDGAGLQRCWHDWWWSKYGSTPKMYSGPWLFLSGKSLYFLLACVAASLWDWVVDAEQIWMQELESAPRFRTEQLGKAIRILKTLSEKLMLHVVSKNMGIFFGNWSRQEKIFWLYMRIIIFVNDIIFHCFDLARISSKILSNNQLIRLSSTRHFHGL